MKQTTGQIELLGQLHQTQRLAVAFGMRAAEIAHQILLGVAALLLADDHHAALVDRRQPADDRMVVGKAAVAVQFDEIGRDALQVIEHVGPFRMPGELDALPRGEVGEDLFLGRLEFFLNGVNLRREIDLLFGGLFLQGFERLLEFGDGFLEFQRVDFHA